MFRHMSQRLNSITYRSFHNKFYFNRKFNGTFKFEVYQEYPGEDGRERLTNPCYAELAVISVEKGQGGACF